MDKEIPLSKLVKMTQDEIAKADRCQLFYDWFCKDTSLPGKSKRLMSTVRAIVKTGTKLFDPNKTYVFFKNNCPCSGGLYDDLRICDIESGDVLFNVCPSDPWCGYQPRVAFESDDGVDRWANPLVFETMKDLRAWFKDPSRFETVKVKMRAPGRWADDRTVDVCKVKAEAKAA
jgi:hypothetical protein